MVSAPRSFLSSVFLLAALTVALKGQTPAAVPVSPVSATNPAAVSTTTPAKEPPTPRRSRAISGETAGALSAMMPKFAPPPPKPPPKPEEELPDLRETDKPKNGIIRLPDFVVQEKKPAVFRERDVYTKKGLGDLAYRRYISDADRALNRYTIPLFGTSAEARALAMYAEDERLRNMSNLNDAASTVSKSDAAAGAYIRREAQKTYMRSSDYGWSSGEPR